jgi:hypothetical protein
MKTESLTAYRDKQPITVIDFVKGLSTDNLNRLSAIINRVLCERHNDVLKKSECTNNQRSEK